MTPLTDKDIRGAKVRVSSNGRPMKYELVDSTRERGVGRLVLRVSSSGSKEFAYKYKIKSKVSYIQLGRYPSLSLADARVLIRPLVKLLRSGADPKLELEAQRKEHDLKLIEASRQGSIEQLFKAYTEQMQQDGKRSYKAVLASLVKETYSFIPPDTKAKEVTKEDIKKILASMIARGAPTQSNRVRSYLMAAFNYALEYDNNPASMIKELSFGVEHNPVSAIPKQKYAEKVGDHYLTFEESLYVMSNFGVTNRIGRLNFALLVLCFFTGGQRPYELLSSKWASINWDEKTLLITSDISKNKKEHLVPLTDSSMMVLSNLCDDMNSSGECQEYIFSSPRSHSGHLRSDSFTTSITRFVACTPSVRKFVARDIRRTCKTLMGELGVSKEIRDRIQNHALTDVSSKHYDRYDYLREKRSALLLWEKKLLSGSGSKILIPWNKEA